MSADARTDILGRIAVALGPAPEAPSIPRAYRRATPSRPSDADRSNGDQAQLSLIELFKDRVADYRAQVSRCTPADLPTAIAAALDDAASLVVPAGIDPAWPAALPERTRVTHDEPGTPLSHADLDATHAVLTTCRVGIAETGTIVLDGGPGQGRRALSLIPDRHVCVVMTSQIVAGVPDAVALLGEHPHRPLTWISGPSATSDIELVRVEGVHGPRDLRVIIVAA